MMIDNKDTNFLPLSPSGRAIFKLEPPTNEWPIIFPIVLHHNHLEEFLFYFLNYWY
jgi:hypothetical protein